MASQALQQLASSLRSLHFDRSFSQPQRCCQPLQRLQAAARTS
jgi:hypothetical protein